MINQLMSNTVMLFTKEKYVQRLRHFLNKEHNENIMIFTKETRPELLPESMLGISYCYPRMINESELKIPELGWINYHPAPLPKYKGGDPYSQGVIDKITSWGTTIHFMNHNYDEGKIITVDKYELGYSPQSREELGAIAHHYCFKLFTETINDFAKGKSLFPWENY